MEVLRKTRRYEPQLIDRFWDAEEGGFFFTAHDAEPLLVRQKEVEDGALPSGNSVALLNLLKIARITFSR